MRHFSRFEHRWNVKKIEIFTCVECEQKQWFQYFKKKKKRQKANTKFDKTVRIAIFGPIHIFNKISEPISFIYVIMLMCAK